MGQIGFFDEFNRLDRLSKMGDPLEKVSCAVDWEIFRPILEKAVHRDKEKERLGGRPPWDCILMFKILLLQAWYCIADDMTEYMINDRLSFQRFLGLTLGSKVPDAKTIWLFRDTLSKKGMDRQLFDFFNRVMEYEGIITRTGSIVDASFVEVPRQRNTREENKTIKAGEIPEEWRRDTPEDRNKLKQKDTEARWAKKNDELHYGYKDHIKIDKDSKIITEYTVTSASVHDSRAIVGLVDEQDEVIYADSAYVGEELHEEIREVACNARLEIHEKGQRNTPLSEEQKASNTVKSRTRARVEHIFGFMENSMGGLFSRLIGIARNAFIIGIKNLAYNLRRYAFIVGNKRIVA